MSSLVTALQNDANKDTIVDDCLALIDTEVKGKGLLIKGGYKTVKGFKPGFVRNVVRDLLPQFAAALEPIHQEAQGAGADTKAHFVANRERAADALLAITDEKAQRSTNKVVKSAYKRLRGSAKKNVADAIPALAELIDKHAV